MSSLTTTNTSSSDAITVVDWLLVPRKRTSRRVGAVIDAHAFEPESGEGRGTFSVCGSVPRPRRAGSGAGADARRCQACERIIAKGGPAIDPRGPNAIRMYRGTPP
jgi:hypothetical protein